MNRRFYLLVWLFISLNAQSGFASTLRLDPQTLPEWKKGVATFGFGMSTFLISQLAIPIPQSCKWCEPSPFELGLSRDTVWKQRKDAAALSDIVVYGLMPGLGALVAIYDYERPSDAAVNTFALINTALLTYSVTEAVKRSTARARPFGDHDPNDQNLSFVSGHSSMAFAFATASSWLAFKRHYKWAPFVAFLGGVAAVSAGYFRIAAGKHWFSDVAAGAAVGMFTGSVVPLFTFANITPLPQGQGVMLSMNW